jgi:GntR family transcriptional regulator
MKQPVRPCASGRDNRRMTKRIGDAAALKASPGKLYEQVAMLIQKWIENGDLGKGERLPSIASISQSFDVAIVTVRQALALLEERGLVERQQGRGTFVSQSVRDRHWLKIESNWDSLMQVWGRSKPTSLKVRNKFATPLLSAEDGRAAPGYRHLRRVHSADGVPYAVSDLFVDRRHYESCPQRFESEMVIVVLDSLPEVRIESMRQRVTIETADLEHAALLGIPLGSPVGIVRRVICDDAGTVIYLGRAAYRGDIVTLEREIKKPGG